MPHRSLLLLGAVLLLLGVAGWQLYLQSSEAPPPTVKPVARCANPQARDQDDLCFWICRTNPTGSAVITSDKSAGRLFVYDLQGRLLQSVAANHPGNIDARHDFPLGGQKVDLVACNARDDSLLLVYRMNAATRQLERVDNGQIQTGENYGSALHHRRANGRFYAFTTAKSGTVTQLELSDDGAGRVAGRKVREWRIGFCEGIVADDETGRVYVAEEDKGIWMFDSDPERNEPGQLIIRNGQHGLGSDLEGLAIWRDASGNPHLIISNQGRSNFKVFRLAEGYPLTGTFQVQGARETDGLDVCAANLGGPFDNGIFGCHTATGNCPVLLSAWSDIARRLQPAAPQPQ